MSAGLKVCKNCGESIFYDKKERFWKHVFTDLFMCADENTMAEPKGPFD